MRYVLAKYKLHQQELAYRIYIADTLYYNGEDKRLGAKYSDIIKPAPKNTKTGDEIAQEVITKLGLKI